MKEQIKLTDGNTVKINDPDLTTLQELDDHDLLIVMHTQMIAMRGDIKSIKGSFSGKWVERVMVFVLVGVGGAAITIGTNAIAKALGGH